MYTWTGCKTNSSNCWHANVISKYEEAGIDVAQHVLDRGAAVGSNDESSARR